MTCLRTLLICSTLAAVATAEDKLSLARLLPARTPVYLEAKNPPRAELEQLAMWKCFNEPALKKVLEGFAADSLTAQDISLGSAGLTMKYDFRNLTMRFRYFDRAGERSFGLKDRFALAWVGMAEGSIPIDAVLSFAVDGDPQAAVGTVRRIIAAVMVSMADTRHQQTANRGAGEQKGTVRRQRGIDMALQRYFSEMTHQGVTYVEFSTKNVKVYFGVVGSLFIATTTQQRMKACIARHIDPAAGSLVESERYKDILAHARGKGSATTIMLVQPDRAIDALAQTNPGVMHWAKTVMASMGLDAIDSLSSVSRVDGPGITNTMSMALSAQRKPSKLFERSEPAKHDALKFVPKDVYYFVNTRFDLQKYYALFANPMVEQMAQQHLGLRLKEDLVDLIGGEVAIIIAPNKGLIPDMGLIVESPDAKRLEQSLLKLASLIKWPPMTGVKRAKLRGVDAHVLPLGHPRLLDFPLAVTFGVVDGKLVLTPSPLAFQRFVAVQQGEVPNITSNRDFARLRERVPPHALGMSYLDVPRLVGVLYDTTIPLLQGIPQPGSSSPVYELPDAETFTRHLYGRIAWTEHDERGVHWISHSPIDGSGVIIGAIAFGAVYWGLAAQEPAALPVVVGTPAHDAEAMMCARNVGVLSARLRYYRKRHKRYPDNLDALRAKYVPPDTFIVPGTDKPYVYLGPEGKGKVLLHGVPNGKNGFVCVLTRRMRVERVSPEQLKKMLEQDGPAKR